MPCMEQNEVEQRVIGVLGLVISGDWDPYNEPETDRLRLLMDDVLKVDLSVNANASPQQVAEQTVAKLTPNFNHMLGAFCAAFVSLATVNDDPEVNLSSAEVVRALALQWASND
jgi:hypothetical protein